MSFWVSDFSVAATQHHDQGTLQKRTLVRGSSSFQRMSPCPARWGAWQQAGRRGEAGVVTESLCAERTAAWQRDRQAHTAQCAVWEWHGLWKCSSVLLVSTSSNKATPLHPSQTVLPTGDQTFKSISLGDPFSFKLPHWPCKLQGWVAIRILVPGVRDIIVERNNYIGPPSLMSSPSDLFLVGFNSLFLCWIERLRRAASCEETGTQLEKQWCKAPGEEHCISQGSQ